MFIINKKVMNYRALRVASPLVSLAFFAVIAMPGQASIQKSTFPHHDSDRIAITQKATASTKKPSSVDSAQVPQPGHYVSVKEASQLSFNATAKMLGVTSEVPGKFSDFNVSANARATGDSDVTVTIAVKSIDTDNARRDKHLRNADFFDEKQFKTITFKSKKIRHVQGDTYEVQGVLQIKDKTSNLSFTVVAKKTSAANVWQVSGETQLDRNAVGITYQSPFYLPDVGKQIKVAFTIQMKQSPQ